MQRTQLEPWNVRKSWTVHEDRWIKVRADDCVTAKGVEVSPYYVIEYPDWVHIAAIDDAGCVILVRQYRHGIRALSLELPAGNMDAGETDPLAAAARELAEETGYGAREFTLVASLSANTTKFSNTLHVVLAQNASKLPDPPPGDSSEQIEIERVPIEAAVSLALAGKITDAANVSSLLLALSSAGRLNMEPRSAGQHPVPFPAPTSQIA